MLHICIIKNKVWTDFTLFERLKKIIKLPLIVQKQDFLAQSCLQQITFDICKLQANMGTIVINCVHILIIFSNFFQKLLKKIIYYIDRNFLSAKLMCFITHLILVTMSSAIFLLLSGKYFFAYIAPTAFVREPKKKIGLVANLSINKIIDKLHC